jgi:hypothetical protein
MNKQIRTLVVTSVLAGTVAIGIAGCIAVPYPAGPEVRGYESYPAYGPVYQRPYYRRDYYHEQGDFSRR